MYRSLATVPSASYVIDFVPGAVFSISLGPAVAVEVVDEELRVVRAGADVHAEVDAVQQRAVELVGVDVDGPV